jgi:hypothetical protein
MISTSPHLHHPNGKCRSPIHSVTKVHNHICGIPLNAYNEAGVSLPCGRASKVTTEDVDAASDACDARGILHDIDTQWGLIPGGGAYSDRNFYYGPGGNDFHSNLFQILLIHYLLTTVILSHVLLIIGGSG